MTRNLYPYTLVLLFLSSYMLTSAQAPAPTSALPSGIPSTWFQQAQDVISTKQYEIVSLGNRQFAALNPAQHSLFEIYGTGYKQEGINEDARISALAISLAAINGLPIKDEPYELFQKNSSLNIRYKKFTIQYQNTPEGLRQNFIVGECAKNSSGKLFLSLNMETDLSIALDNDHAGISFTDEQGQLRGRYDDLNVWDANGKKLAAQMNLSSNGAVGITVNDENATYPITVDPLNHVPSWKDDGSGLVFPLLNDLTVPLLYGYSVSSAGDVNGDGFGDIIIGAPFYVDILNISGGTFNALSVGAAFLYYGSASGPATTPSEVLQPTSQVGALFGFSVSKAGDVNGDGFGDVVIGAPGDHITLNVGLFPVATSVATGRVYTFYGGPAGSFDGNINTEPTASAIFSPTQADFGALLTVPATPLYGYSVSEAGDVNGDGYADVAVGSPGFLQLLPLPIRAGRVDIYTGGAAGISTVPANSVAGAVLNASFGFSVSTAGDTNNDGYSDIIVGAPAGITILSIGQAFVFNGSASGLVGTPAATLTASGILPTLFGFSVSNAGDVNGDGYGDVIVGEPASLETLLTQTAAVGGASIFYGSLGGITTTGTTRLNSPRRPSLLGLLQGNLLYGYSVSTAGDINCDGLSDVIVGEPGGTALSLGSGLLNVVSTNVLGGQTYIYAGSNSSMTTLPFFTIRETGSLTAANLVGHSVSDAGDVNGDGKSDLLVGSPNGSLNLSAVLVPAVGDVVNLLTTASGGAASLYSGCLSATTLPVNLLSFNAQKYEDYSLITWKTASEMNFSYYQVERSADGVTFTKLGTSEAAGGTGESFYQFIDSMPLSINYYRLKMVDQDGSSRFSDVRIVNFGNKQSELSFIVSPNPARSQFTLALSGLTGGNYELRIHNALGASVVRKSVRVTTNAHTETIYRNGLPAGIYSITLYSEKGVPVSNARLVLQ